MTAVPSRNNPVSCVSAAKSPMSPVTAVEYRFK
eukprot:SAG11_NODE_27726_length_329_cov_3.343478_1_plen_32_part_01